jgi:hypothetical protein
MTETRFRSDLNFYEVVLAEWARFSVRTCKRFARPNGLGAENDNTLELIHEVADGARPIKCKGGQIVRRLRLDFGSPDERTVH